MAEFNLKIKGETSSGPLRTTVALCSLVTDVHIRISGFVAFIWHDSVRCTSTLSCVELKQQVHRWLVTRSSEGISFCLVLFLNDATVVVVTR